MNTLKYIQPTLRFAPGKKLTLLIIAYALNHASAFAQKSLSQSQLMGGWELTDFTIHSPGQKDQDFCAGATGRILYERSGEMSVSINCGPRKEEKEPADAYGRQLFYAAHFKIQGDEVVHTITNSNSPELIGKSLIRKVAQLDKKRLLLTGPLGAGSLSIGWKRADRAPSTGPLAYLTRLKLKPGSEAAFLKALKPIIAFSKSEPGNIAWYVQQGVDDPTEVIFYTRWVDQAAIEWHLGTELLRNYIQTSAGLLAQPAQLTKYRPLDLEN
jgi:quinol monooxygenase YgiN